MTHLLSLNIADFEDADFLKNELIAAIPGLHFLGFAADPNPGAVVTAYIAADTLDDAIGLADQLGVGLEDITFAERNPTFFG